MSEMFDTSQWLAFFTKAGLPPNVAANYALIFSDNRIQLNMLMDLSKEYLYDMGIRVMGDVIAILRFAKEFHTQLAKEKAIGISTVVPQKVVGRMVGHYTRPLRLSTKQIPVGSSEQEIKKVQVVPKKSTIINLKRSSCEELPVKKVRRVSPEEEGAYKIKMPLGTTEKTRKILQQQQQLTQVSKRSVFARLGDSAVSSSTDSTKSSVFQRLGPSNKSSSDDTPTSTVIGETKYKVTKLGPPLQYQGVLKITTGRNRRSISSGISSRTVIKPMSQEPKTIPKRTSLNRINNILQSNSSVKRSTFNRSQGIFSNNAVNKIGIRSRLGAKIDSRNLLRTKVLLNNASERLSVKKESTVFDRLGK